MTEAQTASTTSHDNAISTCARIHDTAVRCGAFGHGLIVALSTGRDHGAGGANEPRGGQAVLTFPPWFTGPRDALNTVLRLDRRVARNGGSHVPTATVRGLRHVRHPIPRRARDPARRSRRRQRERRPKPRDPDRADGRAGRRRRRSGAVSGDRHRLSDPRRAQRLHDHGHARGRPPRLRRPPPGSNGPLQRVRLREEPVAGVAVSGISHRHRHALHQPGIAPGHAERTAADRPVHGRRADAGGLCHDHDHGRLGQPAAGCRPVRRRRVPQRAHRRCGSRLARRRAGRRLRHRRVHREHRLAVPVCFRRRHRVPLRRHTYRSRPRSSWPA